jgi:membrane protein implicated in regulation of membrane protease activity
MSSLLLFWIGTGIIFLIIEMLTATFYGLSVAIAAFVLAVYVWNTGEDSLDIIQGTIFALVTFLTAYLLPKLLISRTPDVPQGIDRYYGEKRKVKKVGEDFKITLDGVEYLVLCDEELKAGDMVEVVSVKGGSLHVKIA